METEFQPLVRIIDDDEAFRDSHEMLFRLEGWDVESFADASSFLEKASTKRPGCILLDIRMPGLSGPQLQEELNRGVSGFLCLGRLFQGQPNEAALCI